MRNWYDPRESWVPGVGLFVIASVFVVDLSRPRGFLDSGLWIPVLYAAVPVALGVLAYVRRRAPTRDLSPLVLVGLTVWGLVGAVIALVVALVIGLGRPAAPGPPAAVFNFVTGLLTYLVPAGVFVGLYGVAGRRSPRESAALAGATPVVVTIVLAVLVSLSY